MKLRLMKAKRSIIIVIWNCRNLFPWKPYKGVGVSIAEIPVVSHLFKISL